MTVENDETIEGRMAIIARVQADRDTADDPVEDQVARLEWSSLRDGRWRFRGALGGHRRYIIGDNRDEMEALARKMARKEA